MYGVQFHFRLVVDDPDSEVYDIIGPFDRYFADLVCVNMASGWMHGPRWCHVTRAIVVPWTA